MKDLRRLLTLFGEYRRDLFLAMGFVLIETFFELVIPVLMADLIDVGVAGGDVHYILVKGAQMGLCAVLALIAGLLYARFAARAAYGWGANVRLAQFERVQAYAFGNLDRFETSSLVTRMTTDVTVLQNAVNGGLRPLVRSPVMLCMGVGLSFMMNARLALVFVVCAPVLACILFSSCAASRRVTPCSSGRWISSTPSCRRTSRPSAPSRPSCAGNTRRRSSAPSIPPSWRRAAAPSAAPC